MNSQQFADGGSRLDWPEGFDRTPPRERESYPHGFRVSRSDAFDNVLEELRKIDARNVQLDTGAEHQKRNPNKPYANSDFDDPGVVVYYEKDGQQFAVPCDRWDNPRDNAQAIARYLDAKRAIQRYGVSTVGSEYQTQALPSGDEDVVAADEPANEILGVAWDAPAGVVKAAARALKKQNHPDNGGSTDQFQRIVEAEEEMLHE